MYFVCVAGETAGGDPAGIKSNSKKSFVSLCLSVSLSLTHTYTNTNTHIQGCLRGGPDIDVNLSAWFTSLTQAGPAARLTGGLRHGCDLERLVQLVRNVDV